MIPVLAHGWEGAAKGRSAFRHRSRETDLRGSNLRRRADHHGSVSSRYLSASREGGIVMVHITPSGNQFRSKVPANCRVIVRSISGESYALMPGMTKSVSSKSTA